MLTAVNLHEGMVDERTSSWSLQHVVHGVLQPSVAFVGHGGAAPGSRGPRERVAQQPGAVGRVSALWGGRLAPLRVDSSESHELDPPVVVWSRGRQHSNAAVIGRTS